MQTEDLVSSEGISEGDRLAGPLGIGDFPSGRLAQVSAHDPSLVRRKCQALVKVVSYADRRSETLLVCQAASGSSAGLDRHRDGLVIDYEGFARRIGFGYVNETSRASGGARWPDEREHRDG